MLKALGERDIVEVISLAEEETSEVVGEVFNVIATR